MLRTALIGGLLACLLGCEPAAWLQAGGVRAFREVGAPEALEILADPAASVLQLRARRWEPTVPRASLVGLADPIPPALLEETGRVLVVAADGAAGRRLSARLVRAGVRRVVLVVGDPGALGAGPVLARPAER
ncbi:MAG: hypothetical protein ABFS46_11780 [Myxococcota bacterium]